MSEKNVIREVEEVLPAQTSRIGGVILNRVFGGENNNLERFDPFLLLDDFAIDPEADHMGSLSPHPHRGFETITYMLAGQMGHSDHLGNKGDIRPGGVQWMKAGSGVIHAEEPKQEEGNMRGFQLWLNLPASEKMTPATYDDIGSADIPNYQLGNVEINAIAGELTANNVQLKGAVTGRSTDPGCLNLVFKEPQQLDLEVPDGYTVLMYVYAGSLQTGENEQSVSEGEICRFSRNGGLLRINASAGTRVWLMSGRPIGEPIVQHGPFVMNTVEEIQKAINDYNAGNLV